MILFICMTDSYMVRIAACFYVNVLEQHQGYAKQRKLHVYEHCSFWIKQSEECLKKGSGLVIHKEELNNMGIKSS